MPTPTTLWMIFTDKENPPVNSTHADEGPAAKWRAASVAWQEGCAKVQEAAGATQARIGAGAAKVTEAANSATEKAVGKFFGAVNALASLGERSDVNKGHDDILDAAFRNGPRTISERWESASSWSGLWSGPADPRGPSGPAA